MTTSATVSVAIASYNGARHIQAQLDSIGAQTIPPSELIVADDCSTDATCEIVSRFAAGAAFPVKLVRNAKNVGILENFYTAFAACSGDIIYYCDQDDVWLPTKIEKTKIHFTAATSLVMHQSEITDDALIGQGRVEPRNPRYGRLAEPVDALSAHGYGHQMAFRREVFNVMRVLKRVVEQADGSGLANNFDQYIPFCASLVGDIVLLPDALTRFRRHGAATTDAGVPVSTAVGSDALAWRVRAVATREVEASAARLKILGQGRSVGALGPTVGRPAEHALVRQHHRAAALQRVAGGSHVFRRISLLPTVLWAALRPTGFSNDRRGRFAALALAAALTQRKAS